MVFVTDRPGIVAGVVYFKLQRKFQVLGGGGDGDDINCGD
jgi:hypothetical protein